MDSVEFEEKNWDWLIDKFMKIKVVREAWEDFVYTEYQNQPEPPDRDD